MATTVYKFGGSSLGTIGRLTRVAQLIVEAVDRQDRLVVVVSALGDTTDWLIAAARAAADGDQASATAQLTLVAELAHNVARAALVSSDVDGRALHAITAQQQPLVQELQRIVDDIALARALPLHTLDEVLAFGERISATIVAGVVTHQLRLHGSAATAEAFDARELVVTDDTPQAANVDTLATGAAARAVLLALPPELVAIVTGFIGRSSTGRTTTLGRNGSDYTAALLAAALGADQLTVWTDVAGVCTADPRLVDEAYPVTHLTYREALELAHFGTTMFHARTVIPLIDAGIALTIRSTVDQHAPGTRIDAHGHGTDDQPTCITSLEQLALILVEAQRSALPTMFHGGALTALAEGGVRVWMSNQTGLGVSASYVVPQLEQARAHSILTNYAAQAAHDDVVVRQAHQPVTLITLVAERMGRQANVAGRFFAALGTIGIRVRAIAQGASERSISCVVDAADTAAAVRSVHAVFNFAEPVIHILLLGRGTVGRSLLTQLAAQTDVLRTDHGVRLKLVGLADSSQCVFDERGVTDAQALAQLAPGPKMERTSARSEWGPKMERTSERSERGKPERTSARWERGPLDAELLDRLSRLSAPVLVDCTAAEGMEQVYAAAFRRGIHVVAANKKPLTIDYPRRQELIAAARHHSRSFLYETTCGASLPVIETLKNLVRTGDVVHRIEGSLSGTLAYLADELMHGVPLSRAVAAAQRKGLTEPHPRDDLSGLDVARKAVILARELGCAG